MAIPGVVEEIRNFNGMAEKVPSNPVTGNQRVTRDGSNTFTPTNENPGALAGATGANWKSVGDLSKPYLKRVESATSLCLSIKACHPSDACEIMAAALTDLSAGMPIAPLYSPMDEAGFWADLATRAELKAYALACFTRLSKEDRAAFLQHVGRAAA